MARNWTMIYWDYDERSGQVLPHVRLLPDFVDLSQTGRNFGLSIGGPRKNEADAKEFAVSVNEFMEFIVSNLNKELYHVV